MAKMKRKYNKPICPDCGANRQELQHIILHGTDPLEWINAMLKFSGCKRCRNELYIFYRRVTGLCEVCGLRLDQHPRCSYCGILVGDGHNFTGLIEGLCPYCYKWEHSEKGKIYATLEIV